MIDELNGDFLQWLRGFYWVAKTGSVRRAAEHMHRNPSTISYQLRSLEEALNTVLFDRYKKSLRITPEGTKLLDWAITTFEALQSMRSSVGSADGELKGSVNVAATLPIATLSVPTTVDFLRRYPGVALTVTRGLSSDVRRDVAESRVDFGLLPVIEKPADDRMDVVFKSRPLLVMHRSNPWDIPLVPDIDDLRRLPYVAFADDEDPDDLGCWCRHSGMGDFIQKNAVIRVSNYHLAMRYVWHRLGVAIMDELCLQGTNFGADWEQIVSRPLDHLFPNRLCGILVRRHKHVSPQAQALIQALRGFFLSLPALDAEIVWRNARQITEAAEGATEKAGRRARPSRSDARKPRAHPAVEA